MEKNRRFFYISLFVMSVCNIVNAAVNIFELELPDYFFVIHIILLLASVLALIYFSIKLWLGKMDNKKLNL